jgi:hypothetical protein
LRAILHHFGGIERARRAAKLPDPPQYREWTQEDVTTEIRRYRRTVAPPERERPVPAVTVPETACCA